MSTPNVALLFRVDEVVEMTSLSKAKVYMMAASGQLPTLRAGRSLRVPLEGLRKWIEANTNGGVDAL